LNPQNQHQWLAINVGAAQTEALGLKQASDAGVTVPDLVARDRHAVLMSEIPGAMLFKCTKEDIKRPKQLLRKILENIRKAYKADMINGDISEFNILFDGLKPWIIDWPQFVPITHANAKEMLRRDVENSILFFTRKFDFVTSIDEAISYVSGQIDKVKIS
jgi:RIO kinase 2